MNAKIDVGAAVSGFEILGQADEPDKPGRHWHCRCLSCGINRVFSTSQLNADRARCRCTSRQGQRTYAIRLTHNGITRTVAGWAKATNTPVQTLYSRLKQRPERYKTDAEVIYGRVISDDPRRLHTSRNRREEYAEKMTEDVIQSVQTAVTPVLLSAIRTALRPMMLDLVQQAYIGHGTEDDDSVDLGVRMEKPDLPPHPRDDEVIPTMGGRTLRDIREVYYDGGESLEEVERMTRGVLETHDEDVEREKEEAATIVAPDEDPIDAFLARWHVPRVRTDAIDEKLGVIMGLEDELLRDELGPSDIAAYMTTPWWDPEQNPGCPEGPFLNQRERIEQLRFEPYQRFPWTKHRANPHLANYRECNRMIDLALMTTWLKQHKANVDLLERHKDVIVARGQTYWDELFEEDHDEL